MRRPSARRGTLIQRSRRVAPSAKAGFHHVTGAGRSKVLRQFFGVSDKDNEALVAFAGPRLDKRLNP